MRPRAPNLAEPMECGADRRFRCPAIKMRIAVMNPRLLALIEAYHAALDAREQGERERLTRTYEAKLTEFIEGHPGQTSPQMLDRVVALAHRRWLKAEDELRQRRLTT